MPSNGFFAEGKLQPLSSNTWDDLTNGWDTYTTDWYYTPSLPLTYTTPVVDAGRIDNFNYLCQVAATHPVDITVKYGNTVDSSGGAIDSPTTVNVTPGTTSLSGANARYFEFTISVNYADSAGAGEIPTISSVETNLSSEIRTISINGVDSSTLSGSAGERQLGATGTIGLVTGAVVTAHGKTGTYVADGYIEAGDSAGGEYLEEGDVQIPYVTLNKSTSPISLRIYDLNTFGPNKIDCTFDAVLTGLPNLSSDGDGNIIQG